MRTWVHLSGQGCSQPRCGHLASAPWAGNPRLACQQHWRQLCESKDINVSIVAPRVDVGLASIFMHRQTLD